MARITATARRKATPARPASEPPPDILKSTGSLTVQVTDRIRQAIVDGVHPLGEALSELRLADALGVSRTPVRDALMALQMQGLIDIRPQAGSYVFMPSEENVGELCEFRRVLELMALRLCFARRRAETLLQMRLACDAMDRANAADDRLAGARGDTAFHEAIAQNSANEYLIGAYKLVSGRVAALRTHNLASADNLREKSMSEHRAIMRAFAKGDLGRAEGILDEHISRMHSGFRAARRRETSAGSPALAADAAKPGARRMNKRSAAPPPTRRPARQDAQ